MTSVIPVRWSTDWGMKPCWKQVKSSSLVLKMCVGTSFCFQQILTIVPPLYTATNTKVEVTIAESKEFKNTVDKLLVKANLALVVGTSSWREQFRDALTVSGSADDDSSEPSTPSYGDYMMHYLTVFWKLFFAIVPPTDIWGGWACFVVSIIMIGVLTAFIGDIASHFGCTIGLADSVVAITFVALGTSLPGMSYTS